MRRSKLETCLCILEILDSSGPLKTAHIMQKANVNCNVLKNCFDFLITQGVVEEAFILKNSVVYAITERGLNLIRAFKELTPVIPMVKIESVIR